MKIINQFKVSFISQGQLYSNINKEEIFVDKKMDWKKKLESHLFEFPWKDFKHNQFWYRYFEKIEPGKKRVWERVAPFYVNNPIKATYEMFDKSMKVIIKPYRYAHCYSLIVDFNLPKGDYSFEDMGNIINELQHLILFRLNIKNKTIECTLTEMMEAIFNEMALEDKDIYCDTMVHQPFVNASILKSNDMYKTIDEDRFNKEVRSCFRVNGELVDETIQLKKLIADDLDSKDNNIGYGSPNMCLINLGDTAKIKNKKNALNCYHNNTSLLYMHLMTLASLKRLENNMSELFTCNPSNINRYESYTFKIKNELDGLYYGNKNTYKSRLAKSYLEMTFEEEYGNI